MNARSLQEDLLSIPGVEGAEVEGSADRPAGLRIRIAEGADQQAVGGAIRRVLTSHGLGTDTRLPGEGAADGAADADDAPAPHAMADAEPMADGEAETAAEAEPAPAAVAVAADEVGAVIDLTDDEPDATAADATLDDEGLAAAVAADDAPPEEEADVDGLDAMSEPEPAQEPPLRAEEPAPGAAAAETPVAPAPVDAGAVVGHAVGTGVARLGSVAVEEGRDGIVVTVAASDGTQISQAAASTEGGVETAVVRATAKLALPDAPEASVIEIEDRRVEGVDIVMIVLDVDGRKMAGSAVVGAGRPFALARATWSALSM